MWIAKPVLSLSESEKASWSKIEAHLPLAQTLSWAQAIEAVSGKAFLVFSPDEGVGGILFSSPNPQTTSHLRFECINGPSLHWDNPVSAPRQLATFAMAVSKIDRGFESLVLKPRWELGQSDRRLRLLPIPAFRKSQAATLIVPVQKAQDAQFQSLSSRMRRTLSVGWRSQVETQWERLTPQLLDSFVPAMKKFGDLRGFSIPPLPWFKALIGPPSPTVAHSPTFWLATARKAENGIVQSITQILVCMRRERAHYLFGYEERTPGLRGAVSTSAAVHWETLLQCATAGVRDYDLNGYLSEVEQDHPYYGVCRFKEQFSGNVVNYDVPEFLIE